MNSKLLLITPPFTQLNTPYPAGPFLKRYLGEKNISVEQADLSIDLFLEIFSEHGLKIIFKSIDPKNVPYNYKPIYYSFDYYINTINSVINFLQGKNPALSFKIASRNFLPEGNRFKELAESIDLFESNNIHDKALHLCTIYIEEICDFISSCADPLFSIGRYAEHTSMNAAFFKEYENSFTNHNTVITKIYESVLKNIIELSKPDFAAFSIPFPGNLFFAFLSAKYLKLNYPNIKIIFGGGFANTELRNISNINIFKYTDFITLDDGELPLEKIVTNSPENEYVRTYYLKNNCIHYSHNDHDNISHAEAGWPDYSGLNLNNYISLVELSNPMHRLWSEGHWNKMTLAHGCYHAGCAFCDTSLDYIKRYDPCNIDETINRIKILINETGCRSFHFTDEAAPPALLKKLAIKLIQQNITISWWTNVRFENGFTPGLCRLLSESGCTAVAGGLESATDPILKKINKKVSFKDATLAAYNFSSSGIMVHAYLMYGFPGQNTKDTITALENVRQLFEAGCIQSGFWHLFTMTAHSPVGLSPEKYSCINKGPFNYDFTHNDLQHEENNQLNHEKFGKGLKTSLYNYMHNHLINEDVRNWFDFNVPQPLTPKGTVINMINSYIQHIDKNNSVIWIGGNIEKDINGIRIYDRSGTYTLHCNKKEADFLKTTVNKFSIENYPSGSISDLEKNYINKTGLSFEDFKTSELFSDLNELGLIIL